MFGGEQVMESSFRLASIDQSGALIEQIEARGTARHATCLEKAHPFILESAMKLRAMSAAALFCVSMAQAAPVTLNFDGAVDTDITSDFAGLTFVAPGSGSPVRTWAFSGADTPGNVLGLTGTNNFALNQTDGTAIDILFATGVTSVSIRAAFVQASDAFLGFGLTEMLPFMAVYNSHTIDALNRIGLDTWSIPSDSCLTSGGLICQSAYDTLAFTSSSADIMAIRISGFGGPAGTPQRRSIFDTLTYDSGVGNPGGGTVPEPASIALVGLALVALRSVRQRQTPRG